ncbi:MAG TPA: 50S ribosomal protein L11 methyltransferase [Vicinamibacterales bacterium]|nr:50S ribosomal protein L11 methyltransferase [Vicinamibacterales bacterium]
MRRIWPALDIAEPSELLQAALTDFQITAIDETAPDRWRVVFQHAGERDRARESLAAAFPGVAIEPVEVEDEDWAARSQAALRAISVGRVIVAPPWDVPVVVTIRPSTGFGTGHHATTRLCLAALQQIDLHGKTVIDAGTGSGVLAIAASRLGASNVIGFDNDPDAIQAARDNLRLNAGAAVTFEVDDLRRREIAWADVVLANLTGGLLVAASDALRRLMADGGRLILSGFLTHEERDVMAAYDRLSVEHRAEEEGWVCVTLR